MTILTSCFLKQDDSEDLATTTTAETTTTKITSHTCTFSDWSVTIAPTCTTKGEKIRICRECSNKEIQEIDVDPTHNQLIDRINNSYVAMKYSELYSIYQDVLAHNTSKSCNIHMDTLLGRMIYGYWKNASGKYISYRFIYEDYNNTYGSTWYGTNLATSKESGRAYYYYTAFEDNKLIIGYIDKLTEVKTNNFVITFNSNSIYVNSLIDNVTYYLEKDDSYEKIVRDNCKLAYSYIASHILTFYYPSTLEVTSCFVDYDRQEVFAVIKAANSSGTIVTVDYVFYMNDGECYMEKYEHNYGTNIDLEDLNRLLKDYIS